MSGLLKSELVGPGLNAANRNGTGEASARRCWMLTEMRLRSRCELHTFPLCTSNIVAHKCPHKTEQHEAAPIALFWVAGSKWWQRGVQPLDRRMAGGWGL